MVESLFICISLSTQLMDQITHSNRMCDSGVVSCSVRMFPMYREHQRR